MSDKNKRGGTRKKESFLSSPLALVLGAIVILAIVAGISTLLFSRYYADKTPIASVEEITLDGLPGEYKETAGEDIYTAGFYQYEAGTNTYVLLSFGEVDGVAMNVTPNISGTSVYFAVSSTTVTPQGAAPVYRVFKTDAAAISADETSLKTPYYGVGSAGMNYGWVESANNGEYYITPLFDTVVTDRIFVSRAAAQLSSGLYYYEYSIESAGAYVTSATKLDDYSLWVTVDEVDEDELTADLLIGDEQIRLTVSTAQLDEDSMTLITETMNQGFRCKVTLTEVAGTASIQGVDSLELTLDTENEEGADNSEIEITDDVAEDEIGTVED